MIKYYLNIGYIKSYTYIFQLNRTIKKIIYYKLYFLFIKAIRIKMLNLKL